MKIIPIPQVGYWDIMPIAKIIAIAEREMMVPASMFVNVVERERTAREVRMTDAAYRRAFWERELLYQRMRLLGTLERRATQLRD